MKREPSRRPAFYIRHIEPYAGKTIKRGPRPKLSSVKGKARLFVIHANSPACELTRYILAKRKSAAVP